MAPKYNSDKGGFECKAGETNKAPLSDGFIKGYYDDNDNFISIQPSDDIAKIFSTHSFFLVTWTYDATDIKIEKKNITLTDTSAPRSLRARKPSATANTTTQSKPNDGALSRRGNGNNNSTRHRSTSRGNNSRRTSTTSQNNNTTQSQSTSRSNNNTTHPGREGGRTGARTDTALQASSSPRGNNNNNNNRGGAARSSSLSTAVSTSQTNGNDIAKQSKKKSKIETKTIPIPPTKSISVASTSSRGRRPVYNNCRVDVNLFQCGVEVNFTDIADNTTKCGRLTYWDKDDRTWMIREDSDGSFVNVDPNDIVGFKEFIPTIVKRQVDERPCYEVMAIGYAGDYYITPDSGGYWSVLLQSDAFKRFNNANISGNKRDLSRPSSGASQSSGHGGGDFPIFLSPEISREKVDNSTGLTPSTATLGLTPLFKTAVGGNGLFGNDMVVEGGSGGDTPTTQHPSLSLQEYNNQTPVDANNNLGDYDIDLGGDTVHQLASDFAGGTSAAHNDMVLQSTSNQPPTYNQNLPQPPEEEQPAAPLSSNNKEETINTYVAEASSLFETLSKNVFTNPVFQYMLKQSVASKVASVADLRQHYLTKVQRWQSPNHYISIQSNKSISNGCRQVLLRYQGIKGALFISGIESFDKAKVARIVILLTLIPSWDKENMTLAEKEYEIKRASIAAKLATGVIGNVKELDSTSNISYTNRDGWIVDINYNGSTKTGSRIQVTCKSKEHAKLVRKELYELLTADTDTAYAHLSGDKYQEGNICDPSVPVGPETDVKVEVIKYLAKERLIKTGEFNNYRPGWLAVYWSNAQDNALKDHVLNGMIGGNACNKRQQNMNMSARIYLGVDWEAASLISELKGRTAYACEIRWYKHIANVPRHVPVLLRPFYCAALTGEGRIRVFQQKDAILNAILRDGTDDDDEQEVVVEEKEEEEMEVLAPSQVRSGEDFGGAESSNHYDDTTVPIDFNQQPDPVKSGEDDVSTKFEHDMRKEEAVEHDDDDDEDLDKELRQMMGFNKDDADIQTAFKQRMIEFGGNGDTLAPFTAPIPKKLPPVPAKKPSEPASEFYSMQLYKRIQNSKSTSDVVKQCKELSYDKIRMLFEADMQQFFNNNDKRKSNLYMAVFGKTTKAYDWQNISSIVGTSPAYCDKYWKDSIRAICKNNKHRGKLAKEADKVNILMRGALTKLLEEHGLIEKSVERESLIGTDVVIEQKLPSLPQEGGM